MPGSSPGMTTEFASSARHKHTFAFSRRDAPEVCLNSSRLENQRAQETPGARCARSLACSCLSKAHEHSHHRFTGSSRRFPRNGFDSFLRALPGVPSLIATVDTGTGCPGPHDFSVRNSTGRLSAPIASHRIRPAFVTIARAPLCGTERRRIYTESQLLKIRIFLQKRLDSKLENPEILPDGQIS
jgi:hypothetical protein